MGRRILSFPLDGWVEPPALFEELFGTTEDAVWLDSGADASTGFSYLGAASDPKATLSLPSGTVTRPEHLLDLLRGGLAGARLDEEIPLPDGGFRLGWVGWLGYEFGAQLAGVPAAASRYPGAALLFVDRAVLFDHRRRTVVAFALDSAMPDAWAERVREAFGRALRQAQGPAAQKPVAQPPAMVSWRHDDDAYLELILRCQEEIRLGNAYQLCLTNEVRVETKREPFTSYLALRSANPTHHGGFLRIGGVAILSSSPEEFLSISPDGTIRTRPIKGTRPRGETPERDAELRDELAGNEKERAENIMIVDLMRNDLSRVADPGSVVVTELLAVESYAQVHQLVSTVSGILRSGVSGPDAVLACFPAGSMTGAPKRSAMQILHRLEAGPRGVYAGCFGYFGLDGRVDLAMVIRTIVMDGDGASIGTGGGITALSVPAEECAEMHLKADTLLAVLGVPAHARTGCSAGHR